MLAELYYPSSLEARELDIYLADGWFRMGQAIFTTNFLKFKEVLYSAIWLRVDLNTFEASSTQRKLLKNNAKFSVSIRKAYIDDTKEALFLKYQSHISFDTAPNLQQLLYGNGQNDIYETLEICIYDQDKLIACGFFDLGETTSAGISCFYDPEYKKYSLGKYLMYLKMDFSQKKGLDFFYLGYFAPGYPLFDYKLDLSKKSLEYLDLATDVWLPIDQFSYDTIPLDIMISRLKGLEDSLKTVGINSAFQYYDFFDADLIQTLNGLRLFDFPVILFCFGVNPHNPMVVFDLRDEQYHLISCHSVYETMFKATESNRFNTHLLQLAKVLFSSKSADTMAKVIATALRKNTRGEFFVLDTSLINQGL
ncbi:arginyl-tRNA--protein arginylyltransferase [Emticicia sp. 17c]|uniref:arginyl-tRNA--protein arginylyltransferase n=1 Tax=Emticicia sp. 17c TaxID=3127704 RepID=UPI00301CBCEC